MNNSPPVSLLMKDYDSHTFLFGTYGKGKSQLVHQQADQEGISYEAMERLLQPTTEQLEQRKKEREEAKMNDEKRLQMVRDAYWQGSDLSDFDSLHDVIVSAFDLAPTNEQIRNVFNLLPAKVIAKALEWGMDDTEVRDDTSLYINANRDIVRKAMESQR